MSAQEKSRAARDERDRIPVEGCFGAGKRRYGLALAILVINIEKIAKIFPASILTTIGRMPWGVRLTVPRVSDVLSTP